MLITGLIYSNQHKQIYIIVSICTYMWVSAYEWDAYEYDVQNDTLI